MADMAAMHDLTPQEHIIVLYEAMAAITQVMLAAARAQDWGWLVTLEATCAAHVATLKQGEPLVVLSAPQRERKIALITRMLADDGELRRLCAARMNHLSNQMSSASTERKLSRAYAA